MNKPTFASLICSLTLVGLFIVSCGTPDRRYDRAGGSGGKDDVASSGRSSTAGRGGTGGGGGSKPSAGSGAMSVGGGDGGGSAAEGGSGAASGGPGMPDCGAGQKLCDGACVNIDDPSYGCDATLCTTTGCPSAAGATLVCNAGQCVIGTCGADSKKCEGRCVSRTDPAYGCGAATCDATTCPSQGTGATLVCEGSACVIGGCPTGYKKCGSKCVAVSDPTYGCGATSCDATSCPAPGTGTLVCQNSACVIGTCGAGTKKCGSNCVTADANNGCADAARCTACANNEACSGTPSTCQCVPTPMATACSGKCGSVSNGCGGMYTCGTCTSPQTCGGGGAPNVCGCGKTAMSTACQGKNCGTVADGCGGTYTCGTCTSPQTCGGTGTANVCGCGKTAMSTACANKNCGTVADGCGGTYTCGTCTSPQTCAGAGTANVCGCNKTAMSTACANKNCGTAADGCGGNYTCGTCSGSTPSCVSNSCKQCAAVTDCPSGTFNCTNNTCVCRTPSSANVIKDGGFDTQSTLNSWTSSGTTWTKTDDADGCPGSGSITISGSNTISRCFQIPKVPAGGTLYALGLRYKTGATGDGGCIGFFNQDASCMQGVGPDFLNLGLGQSSTWATTSTVNLVYEGTASIGVQCQNSSSLTIDQIYLRVNGGAGPGF